MKIHIVLLLSCFFLITKVIAQQTPEYTQYMYNMSVVNPAYVGINEGVSLGFLAKTQWAGVNGAPKSINAFIFDAASLFCFSIAENKLVKLSIWGLP